MEFIRRIFTFGYVGIIVLFVCCGLSLITFAALQLWHGINPGGTLPLSERFNSILQSIGLLTIAVAALELGQTILEEEVQRKAQMSAPTRVRRFLSRFLVVLVVALSIETLVLVFRTSRESPRDLPYAACVGLTAAALLVAWGVFVRLNRSAEELEPEAMEQAKREDTKVEPGPGPSGG